MKDKNMTLHYYQYKKCKEMNKYSIISSFIRHTFQKGIAARKY